MNIKCRCYHADKNYLGEIGVCWGTKECEACLCDGDESRCDFYLEVRKKAREKKIVHNGDKIRSMTNAELAAKFAEIQGDPYNAAVICEWHEWLDRSVDDND